MSQKFPKKLRQKLEKIAAARDLRKQVDDEPYSSFPDTFYRAFFPRHRLHLMSAQVDEEHDRLTMQAFFHVREPAEKVHVPAPWEN